MAQDRKEYIKGLYLSEYDKMVKVAQHQTGDTELSLDLVQDTFVLAMRRYDELRQHPNPEAWLMLTLHNLIRNEFRRSYKHPIISLDELENFSTTDNCPLSEMLPSDLSAEDRKILIWRFEQDMSYMEMAERLGIVESSCRSRISRALERCKNLFKEKSL